MHRCSNWFSSLKTNAQNIILVLNAIVIVGLLVCTVLSGVVMNQQYKTALLLADTKDLSQELRQSSDDLTRFIRTFTVTANESYWEYYLQVVAIRDGEAPLPEEPWRNYWDLYISDGVSPRGFLAPSALLSRLEAAKFDDAEIALFQESKRQSDELIDLEITAYNAMVGKYRPAGQVSGEFSVTGPANQTLAKELVHSSAYHGWKGRIMRPLDDFVARANTRVLASIDTNFKLNLIVVVVLAVMLVALIALLLFYFLKVARDRDIHTAQLLERMLPSRVVANVTVEAFQQLKEQAKVHSRKLRTLAGREAALGSDIDVGFPVLYSEYLPLAWVAFTDVVQFTAMCRYTNARKVISVLNELFSLLDVEAQYYQIDKIKTIGDSFMCAKLSTSELDAGAGGLPKEERVARDGKAIARFLLRAMKIAHGVIRPSEMNKSHALDDDDEDDGDHSMVETPTEDKESVTLPATVTNGQGDGGDEAVAAEEEEEINYAALPSLTLRVGLHVGPVASGIVGFDRPLYDLFGDTVNTAARLEANGRPDRIHVMESTLPYFEHGGGGKAASGLDFEPGEHEVEMKGIGNVKTKFIRGDRSRRQSSVVTFQSSYRSSHNDPEDERERSVLVRSMFLIDGDI